jgi:hypothetical protein
MSAVFAWSVVSEFVVTDGGYERAHLVSPSGVVVATGVRSEWLRGIARILNEYEPTEEEVRKQQDVTNPAFAPKEGA